MANLNKPSTQLPVDQYGTFDLTKLTQPVKPVEKIPEGVKNEWDVLTPPNTADAVKDAEKNAPEREKTFGEMIKGITPIEINKNEHRKIEVYNIGKENAPVITTYTKNFKYATDVLGSNPVLSKYVWQTSESDKAFIEMVNTQKTAFEILTKSLDTTITNNEWISDFSALNWYLTDLWISEIPTTSLPINNVVDLNNTIITIKQERDAAEASNNQDQIKIVNTKIDELNSFIKQIQNTESEVNKKIDELNLKVKEYNDNLPDIQNQFSELITKTQDVLWKFIASDVKSLLQKNLDKDNDSLKVELENLFDTRINKFSSNAELTEMLKILKPAYTEDVLSNRELIAKKPDIASNAVRVEDWKLFIDGKQFSNIMWCIDAIKKANANSQDEINYRYLISFNRPKPDISKISSTPIKGAANSYINDLYNTKTLTVKTTMKDKFENSFTNQGVDYLISNLSENSMYSSDKTKRAEEKAEYTDSSDRVLKLTNEKRKVVTTIESTELDTEDQKFMEYLKNNGFLDTKGYIINKDKLNITDIKAKCPVSTHENLGIDLLDTNYYIKRKDPVEVFDHKDFQKYNNIGEQQKAFLYMIEEYINRNNYNLNILNAVGKKYYEEWLGRLNIAINKEVVNDKNSEVAKAYKKLEEKINTDIVAGKTINLKYIYENVYKNPDFAISFKRRRPNGNQKDESGTMWMFNIMAFQALCLTMDGSDENITPEEQLANALSNAESDGDYYKVGTKYIKKNETENKWPSYKITVYTKNEKNWKFTRQKTKQSLQTLFGISGRWENKTKTIDGVFGPWTYYNLNYVSRQLHVISNQSTTRYDSTTEVGLTWEPSIDALHLLPTLTTHTELEKITTDPATTKMEISKWIQLHNSSPSILSYYPEYQKDPTSMKDSDFIDHIFNENDWYNPWDWFSVSYEDKNQALIGVDQKPNKLDKEYMNAMKWIFSLMAKNKQFDTTHLQYLFFALDRSDVKTFDDLQKDNPAYSILQNEVGEITQDAKDWFNKLSKLNDVNKSATWDWPKANYAEKILLYFKKTKDWILLDDLKKNILAPRTLEIKDDQWNPEIENILEKELGKKSGFMWVDSWAKDDYEKLPNHTVVKPYGAYLQDMYRWSREYKDWYDPARQATAQFILLQRYMNNPTYLDKAGYGEAIITLASDHNFDWYVGYDDIDWVHGWMQIRDIFDQACIELITRDPSLTPDKSLEIVITNISEYIRRMFGQNSNTPAWHKDTQPDWLVYGLDSSDLPPTDPEWFFKWMSSNIYHTKIAQYAMGNTPNNPQFIMTDWVNAVDAELETRQDSATLPLELQTLNNKYTSVYETLPEEDKKAIQEWVTKTLKKQGYLNEDWTPREDLAWELDNQRVALDQMVAAHVFQTMQLIKLPDGGYGSGNPEIDNALKWLPRERYTAWGIATALPLANILGASLDLNLWIAANNKTGLSVMAGLWLSKSRKVSEKVKLNAGAFANLVPIPTVLIWWWKIWASININDVKNDITATDKHYIDVGWWVSMIGFIPVISASLWRHKDALEWVQEQYPSVQKVFIELTEFAVDEVWIDNISPNGEFADGTGNKKLFDKLQTQFTDSKPEEIQNMVRKFATSFSSFKLTDTRFPDKLNYIKQHVARAYTLAWRNAAQQWLIDRWTEFTWVNVGVSMILGAPLPPALSVSLEWTKYNNLNLHDTPESRAEASEIRHTGNWLKKKSNSFDQTAMNRVNASMLYALDADKFWKDWLPDNKKLSIVNNEFTPTDALAIPLSLLSNSNLINIKISKNLVWYGRWNRQGSLTSIDQMTKYTDWDWKELHTQPIIYLPLDIPYAFYTQSNADTKILTLVIWDTKEPEDPMTNLSELLAQDKKDPETGQPILDPKGKPIREVKQRWNYPWLKSNSAETTETTIEVIEDIKKYETKDKLVFESRLFRELKLVESSENKDFLDLLWMIDNMYGETGAYKTFVSSSTPDNLKAILTPILDGSITDKKLIENLPVNDRERASALLAQHKSDIQSIVDRLDNPDVSDNDKDQICRRMMQAFARVPESKISTGSNLADTLANHSGYEDVLPELKTVNELMQAKAKEKADSSIQRVIDPSVIWFTAFYSQRVNPTVSPTSAGATDLLGFDKLGIDRDNQYIMMETELKGDLIPEAKELLFGSSKETIWLFLPQFEASKNVVKNNVKSYIETTIWTPISDIPDEALAKILKGDKFDIDKDTNIVFDENAQWSLDVQMIAYLLGDCANESIWFRITWWHLVHRTTDKIEKTTVTVPEAEAWFYTHDFTSQVKAAADQKKTTVAFSLTTKWWKDKDKNGSAPGEETTDTDDWGSNPWDGGDWTQWSEDWVVD